MKPADIYALTTVETVPWDSDEGLLEVVFDVVAEDLDRGAGESPDVSFAVKVETAFDEREGVGLVAVLYEGRPIACVLRAGELIDRVHEETFVTDVAGYDAAMAAFDRLRQRKRPKVVGAGTDVAGLDGFGAWRVRAEGGRAVVVREHHLDAAGRVIFDEKSFLAEEERTLNPAYDAISMERRDAGLADDGLRAIAAEAVARAVPGRWDTIMATPTADARDLEENGWWPVLVDADGVLHAVGVEAGVPTTRLSWVDGIRVRRIGTTVDADAAEAS